MPVKKDHTQEILLRKIPDGAQRIKVRTELGKTRYRPIGEVAKTDTIEIDVDGNPVVMMTNPGRRKKVRRDPAHPVAKKLMDDKGVAISNDPIMKTVREDPESPTVLQFIIQGLGEEQASLKFEREEMERKGKDTAALSTKRIQALRVLSETWLKRMDQLGSKSIDLEGGTFGALFGLIVDTFQEAMMGAKIQSEQINTVLSKLSLMLDDKWKAEARSRMKKGQ